MAYGRSYRYRKNYKRRGYRFSRFNLYRKRSSKAQSAQIYRINKKVNKLKRDISPDISRVEGDEHYYFTNSTGASVTKLFRLSNPVIGKFDANTNKIAFRGGKLYGQLRYADTSEQTTSSDHYHSASIRFIIFQLKAERNTWNISAYDLINYSNLGTDYNLNCVRPLKEGVGAFVKIVHDRVFNITDDREVLNFKFKLPATTFKRLANTNNVMANEYGLLVVTSGMKWDRDYSQSLTVDHGTALYYNADQ